MLCERSDHFQLPHQFLASGFRCRFHSYELRATTTTLESCASRLDGRAMANCKVLCSSSGMCRVVRLWQHFQLDTRERERAENIKYTFCVMLAAAIDINVVHIRIHSHCCVSAECSINFTCKLIGSARKTYGSREMAGLPLRSSLESCISVENAFHVCFPATLSIAELPTK